MTKDELIEAMKDFPGDMEVKVRGYDTYLYDLFNNLDIDYIDTYDESGEKFLVIKAS